MSIASLLTTTGTVKRRSRTADGQGGFTYTLATQGTVACRISRERASERLRGNKEEGLGAYNVYTLIGVDLEVGDNLEDGSLTYEIISLSRPSGNSHWEFEATLIEARS